MRPADESLILRIVLGLAFAVVVVACITPKNFSGRRENRDEKSWWRCCAERMVRGLWPLTGQHAPLVMPCRVANLNMGGRFANVMEFVSIDPSWSKVYENMLNVLEEIVPSCIELKSSEDDKKKKKWRDIYRDLNNAAGLDLRAKNRPSALHGRKDYWYAKDDNSDPIAYVKRWDNDVVIPGGNSQDTAARKELRALDLMFETALSTTFKHRADFDSFEKQFLYVTRDWTAWQRKLEILLLPLLEKECQVIALQEAFWRGSESMDSQRQAELLLQVVNSKHFLTYSIAAKPSAELVLLWHDESAHVIILQENDDIVYTHTLKKTKLKIPRTKSLENDLIARDPFEDPSLAMLEAAEKRKAAKAIDTTRRRTLIVDLGHYCVAAIHAREHKNCAQMLAYYFADIAKLIGKKKATIFLSDTNLEASHDISTFSNILQNNGLNEFLPLIDTTFKQRTVFQAQTQKAYVPPPPRPFVDASNSFDGVFSADREAQSSASTSSIADDIAIAANPTPQHLIVAPKDRIICTTDSCLLVSRSLIPTQNTANSPSSTSRLPTPDWPSDHLAYLANLLIILQDNLPHLSPAE